MLKRISFLTLAFSLIAIPVYSQVYIKSNPASSGSGPGTGDVNGPGSATDGAFTCFDGTTGKLIKECATQPAPSDAKYITQTTNSGLSAEQSLGALTTAVLLNTVTASTGVLSAVTTQTCTNQFIRVLSASFVATCATVSLTADVTGDLPFSNLAQASAASKLLGRGSASGAGDYQEITVGTGLSMSGTTLSATGSGTGDVVGPASAVSGNIATYDGITGKLIDDSGIAASDLLAVTGTPAQGDIFYFDSTVQLLNKSATASSAICNTGTSNNPAWCVVATAASSTTFTNKTYDTEATGNVFKDQTLYDWDAGISQNSVAAVGFNLPASNPCVAADSGQQDAPFSICSFQDGTADTHAFFNFYLPAWFDNTGQVDVIIEWYANSTSTNSARLCTNTTSKAAGEGMLSYTFNDESCTAFANTGTTANLLNIATLSNIDISDWAAGEFAVVDFYRDQDGTGDNLTVAALIRRVQILWRMSK